MTEIAFARPVFLHELVLNTAGVPQRVQDGDIVRVLGLIQPEEQVLSRTMKIADPIVPPVEPGAPLLVLGSKDDRRDKVTALVDTKLVNLAESALTEGHVYLFYGEVTDIREEDAGASFFDDRPVFTLQARFARAFGDADMETYYHAIQALRAVSPSVSAVVSGDGLQQETATGSSAYSLSV
jgi:hypothetical protein